MSVFSENIPEIAKEVVDFVNCPCEFIPAGKTQAEIMDIYYKSAEQGRQNGFTPVLIVLDEYITDYFGLVESNEIFKQDVLMAERFDPEEWFEKRFHEDEDYYSCDFEDIDEDILNKQVSANNMFCGVINYKTKLSENIVLAKIPTEKPWEIFAYIPFGGWNECPFNYEIMQIAEYWNKKYNAVPAVITHDILEFVAEPVKDDDEAKKLAREQFIFCNDIVSQGVGNIKILEYILKNSNIWYFWWD